MEIEVGLNNDEIFAPDIQDNLKLPPKQQFVFVLRRASRFQLQSAGAKTSLVGGRAVTIYDDESLIRLCVKEIRNAPLLREDNGTREMTLSDVFTMPELESIALQLNAHVSKLISKGRVETKNS